MFPGNNFADLGEAMRQVAADALDLEGDLGEVPPSAALACLLADAARDGWDFGRALSIAILFGPLTATEIAQGGAFAGGASGFRLGAQEVERNG